MQAGQVADQPMVELLCGLVAQGASGRLEVREDKRRRQLFFEGGEVRFTKSNLKSESLEVLAVRHSELEPEALVQHQHTTRLRRVLDQTAGEWSFTPNSAPPSRTSIDLLGIAWRHVLAGSMDRVDARLAGLGQRFPRLTGRGAAVSSLPLDGGLIEMLGELDGARTMEDVLSFAPADPDRATMAMYLALVTGAVDFTETGDDTEIHTTAMAEPEAEFLFEDEFDDDPNDFDDVPDEDAPAEALRDEPTAATFDPSVARLRAELERVQSCEDYFAVLEIHWDASESEYRKAWFRQAQQWHPDRWQSESEAARALVDELFASLNEAWSTLGDAGAREAYINSVIHGIQSEEELAMEKVRAILAAEDQFKAGLQRFHRGDLVGAHEYFKTAHEMVPEESEFQAYYGFTFFKTHWGRDNDRAQEGVTLIKAAIDNHVKLDAGWVLLGKVFREVGKQKACVNAFKRALEMNPGNAEAERELKRQVQTMKKDVEKKKDDKPGFFGRFFGKK